MKIAEIDAQLTELDKTFSWKGIASISSLNIQKSGGEAQGGDASGGASGGETSGCAITSLGGSGCSSKSPRAKTFQVPSPVEPLSKRLKDFPSLQAGQLPKLSLVPMVATNSPTMLQEERWACPIIEYPP